MNFPPKCERNFGSSCCCLKRITSMGPSMAFSSCFWMLSRWKKNWIGNSTCIYSLSYMYMHKHVHVHVHVCSHSHPLTHHTHTNTHTHTCSHSHLLITHTHTLTCSHSHPLTHHTCTQTHILTHVRTVTHSLIIHIHSTIKINIMHTYSIIPMSEVQPSHLAGIPSLPEVDHCDDLLVFILTHWVLLLILIWNEKTVTPMILLC